MTSTQKYGIATMLATGSLEAVLAKVATAEGFSGAEKAAAVAFARQIDPCWKRRDGFIPSRVQKLLK